MISSLLFPMFLFLICWKLMKLRSPITLIGYGHVTHGEDPDTKATGATLPTSLARSLRRQRSGDVSALCGVFTAGQSGCDTDRSEEHTSELQSHLNLVCRLLLEKKTNCTSGSSRSNQRACPLASIPTRTGWPTARQSAVELLRLLPMHQPFFLKLLGLGIHRRHF